MLSVTDIIARNAKRHPDKLALISAETTWTWKQFEQSCASLASLLKALDVRTGSRVSVLADNCPEYLAVFYACSKIGAVFCPINSWYRKSEIVETLRTTDPAAIFVGEAYHNVMVGVREEAGSALHYVTLSGSGPRGAIELDRTMPFSDAGPFRDSISEDIPLCILHTAGTTSGKSKGVVWNRRTFLENGLCEAISLELRHDDRLLSTLPYFHGGGLLYVRDTFMVGGTVTVLSRFDATAALEAIERDRITFYMGVPTMYEMLFSHPRLADYDVSSLRLAVVAGGVSRHSLFGRMAEVFRNAKVIHSYGCTEAQHVSLMRAEESAGKVGSIGKPILGVDVAIVDQQGEEVPAGTKGEIVVKSDVFTAYWGLPDETARAMRDGCYHTGDIGMKDNEGYYYIVGREKELIITGGENVSPFEVEELLAAHPSIVEAAVIGVPDDVYGEKIVAFVHASQPLSVEEVVAYVRTSKAGYKTPKEVYFVNELPKNVLGKVVKPELRKRLAL